MSPRTATSPPPSTITRIDGYELRCALPEPIGNSRVFFDHRRALVLSLTTADGTVGWGETWAMPAAAAAVIRDSLASTVLGKDVHAPRVLWDAMERTAGYDRRGVTHMAMSAIDIAAWDAAARMRGVSVSALLGGSVRDKVMAYVSGPFLKPGADPYRDFDTDIDGYLAQGFRAIKMRLGIDPRNDGARLQRVRDRVGPGFPLMVDLNEGATLRSALVYADAFRDAAITWLEEPIAADNLEGHVRLARDLPMALAGGESLLGVRAFRDYVARGALDIVQPDLALCGGFSEGLRIAALCSAFDLPLVPHVWGTGINFMAALHFTSVLPETRGPGVRYPLFEFDPSPNALRDTMGVFAVGSDGCLAVPGGPGLGLDVTPEALAPYVTDHWVIEH